MRGCLAPLRPGLPPFTAVPHGYGAGAGLPVCLVLHGATARPSDFQPFGLPRS